MIKRRHARPGKELTLPPEAEEVATFYAGMLETDHAGKEVFRNNFFADFQDVLKEHPPVRPLHSRSRDPGSDPRAQAEGIKVASFAKCDFTPIAEWCEAERVKKKSLSKDQKKQIKEAKDAIEEPFKTCLLNGRKEKVGNFRVEPPSLFRGRGAHPKTGMLKVRRTAPFVPYSNAHARTEARVARTDHDQHWRGRCCARASSWSQMGKDHPRQHRHLVGRLE